MNENRAVGNLTIFYGEQTLAVTIDEQARAASAEWVSHPGDPLQIDDLPLDTPLDLRVLDANGTLLLDVGAVLDEVRRAQLFRYFRPHRHRNDEAATAETGSGDAAGETSPYGVEVAESPSDGADNENPTIPEASATAGKSDEPGTRAQRSASAASPPSGAAIGAAPEDDMAPFRRAITEMGLAIGNRLGIRVPMGNGGLAYASRLIGVAPHGPLMVMPPVLGQARLTLRVGETVEVVAVCPRSIYLFACTVEWLATMPFQHVVLSPPARIRKLRERRTIRSPARLAVLYTPNEVSRLDPSHKSAPNSGAVADGGADSDVAAATNAVDTGRRETPGLGVAINISTVGMLLAADRPLGAVGERLKITFYVEAEGVPIAVDVECGIRSVKQSKADGASRGDWVHGLAFDALPPTQRLVLKSYVLSLRVEHDWD